MQKVLVVNPFGIGDVLFTTPVLRALKKAYPQCFLAYWCNERVRAVLENNPNIDRIFALSRGDIKKIFQQSKIKGILRTAALVQGIRNERFGLAFDFSLDHRYSLLLKMFGVKKRMGFNYKNRGRFLSDKIEIDGYIGRHVAEYYLDLLRLAGIKPDSSYLELGVSERAKIKVKNLLSLFGISEEDLLVGIVPAGGASWGREAALKHWPAKNFACLADNIIQEFRAKVIILGDAGERPIADEMSAAMKNPVIDLVGKTSLEDLVALIDILEVLVANDGGPLHIAAARGRKTISFFGPVDPAVYGPYPPEAQKHIVLRKISECSPCYSQFRLKPCQKKQECLQAISASEAFESFRNIFLAKDSR
jgi:lipopolysaccharide heptosyltransferase II